MTTWEIIIGILTIVLGSSTVSTVVGKLMDARANKHKAQSAESKALQMLLYSDIKDACKGFIADGEIDAEDLEVLTKKFRIYHNDLNGNGYLDKLMSAVDELPIK